MSFHEAPPPARWRRSTRCASNGCVEVARVDHDAISVRDTEDVTARLTFDPAEWRRFTDGVKSGHFDHP